MKHELSTFEVQYVVRELQDIVGGKIEKIYQPMPEELLFSIHLTGRGKIWLRMLKGRFILMVQAKGDMPQKPSNFIVYLRKRLENGKIKAITQPGFERIVQMEVEGRQGSFILFIELFGRGNVILCMPDATILRPWEIQKMKERKIQSKERYAVPLQQHALMTLTAQQLMEKINATGKDSVVKALAVEANLGGLIAEELCLRAQVSKDRQAVTQEEADRLLKAARLLFAEPARPMLIFQDGKITDAVPVVMEYYKNDTQQPAASFCRALEEMLLQGEQQKPVKEPEKLKRLKTLVEMQSKSLEHLKQSAGENLRKGELIYEQYGAVKGIIDELKAARKTESWQEIKKRLKEFCGGKIISVNEKENSVVVEME